MKFKNYFKESDNWRMQKSRGRKFEDPASVAKRKDKRRSKEQLAGKHGQHAAMRGQGYHWDKEKMQWVHEDTRGRKNYMDTNPDLEEAIMEILIKFENQNIEKGMTYWRFKNSDVRAELDKDPVYGLEGSNPWLAEPGSKERAIAKIRAEWGLVDPNRGDARIGKQQQHKGGHTQSPLLKPTEPEMDDV